MKLRKQFFIVNICIIFFLLLCSFSKNHISSVSGYVHVYGNEPFTYIGIKTTDNKEYKISADEKTKEELWKSQGKLIEIIGYIEKEKNEKIKIDTLKDGSIEVIEWKYVK